MQRNNFGFLLVALLALLIGVPLLEGLTGIGGPLLRTVAYTTVLILGVWSLRESRVWFQLGMFIAVSGVLVNALVLVNGHVIFTFASLGSVFLFLLLCTWLVMRQVFKGTDVSMNRIAGAICIYLLLGMIWSVMYMTLYKLDPESFRGFTDTVADMGILEFQYYSFVTLTTLGYGEIVPISNAARAFAIVEAILGQFYLAVLVAGLVGAYVADARENQS